jgi:hypothetical protein
MMRGPVQRVGFVIGQAVIAIGFLMLIPYQFGRKKQQAQDRSPFVHTASRYQFEIESQCPIKAENQ